MSTVMLHITPSERVMLEQLAAGAATTEIARQVGLNEHEVDAWLQTLLTRMGVTTRTEAIKVAARRGLFAT